MLSVLEGWSGVILNLDVSSADTCSFRLLAAQLSLVGRKLGITSVETPDETSSFM